MRPPQTIPSEVAEYPLVTSRLRGAERIVARIAGGNDVETKLLYDGGAGITTVRAVLATSFDCAGVDGARKVVERAVKALKQAYDQIREVVWG